MSKFEGLRKSRAGQVFNDPDNQPTKPVDNQTASNEAPKRLKNKGPGERKVNRAVGKSADENYAQLTVYVPKLLRHQVKVAAASEEIELSALVSDLLSKWLNRKA